MTNFDYLKTLDAKTVGHELCRLTECEKCPVWERCRVGRNGCIDYLEDEHKDG